MLPQGREQDPGNTGSGSTATTVAPKHGGRNRHATRALPTAGYLFKDKVDITNIIDPKDMGLTVLQARRKGTMHSFYSPEKYKVQVQQMQKKMESKQCGRPALDSQMWGDSIDTNPSWPKVNPDGHLRILFYNVHGISYKNNYFEMDMIMQMGGQVQADVMLITEVNLNLHKSKVRAKLKESIQSYDKYAKVQMAYPPDEPFTTSDFNMGGIWQLSRAALADGALRKGQIFMDDGVGYYYGERIPA